MSTVLHTKFEENRFSRFGGDRKHTDTHTHTQIHRHTHREGFYLVDYIFSSIFQKSVSTRTAMNEKSTP